MLEQTQNCTAGLRASYDHDGFLTAVPVLSAEEAAAHRAEMEHWEREWKPFHYISKMHTIFPPAAKLATDERVLDVVRALIGPNVLLYDVTYIVKEANTPGHVSWHQDLTYWGLSGDEQVSMWLALSPATDISGCMRMVPGSHKGGRRHHDDIDDETNVLHRGQTVADVAEEQAVMCPLQPGQASFHHGWTLHASMPNRSNDRRIGFNVQYVTPAMRQTINPHETALLVSGKDRYGYYKADRLATDYFATDNLAAHAEMDRVRKEVWDKAG